MGAGWLGWSCNVICIIWTLFICVLFSLPTYFPVTAGNMNYASVITVGVITLSLYVHLSSILLAHSSPFPLKTESGTSLGGLLSLILERYLSANSVCSARRHYKGPVSYTGGNKEPSEGDSREDQSDEKNTSVIVE